jgi:flagellar basal-body rod modification protein FlgD
VTSIASLAGTQPATQSETSSSEKVASLGKDDFLKLLVAQLQHQDPMSPMDNNEYMGQLAQFSTLEQITNVGEEMKRMRATSQVDQAVAMIGKDVGYAVKDGIPAHGVVDSVRIVDGEIILTVGEVDVSPADITSVTDVTTP